MDPLDLIARVTVLLGISAVIIGAFRTRAASTQHLLWTTTFVLLIGLPVAIRWLPPLELSMFPTPDPAAAALPTSGVTSDAPEGTHSAAEAAKSSGITLLSVLTFVWLLGSLAALASLLTGWIRFGAWARMGRPLRDPQWLEALDDLRDRLGIRRNVRLIESSKTDIPMVGGLTQPVVLLPQSATTWSPRRRSAVLAHELIHVRRHDALRQLLSGVALSLYWFHPLSWLAARLSAVSREQACDEGVLQLGTRPSEYAAHLLELAKPRPSSTPLLSLTLIQRSQLETRITAILRPSSSGPNLPLTTVLCILLVICGLATAVAMPWEQPRICEYINPIPRESTASRR